MIGLADQSGVGPVTTRRRVRRILRKFDPWTVLKVSLVLSALFALGFVLLWVILWAIISQLGLATALDSAAERVALIEPGASLFKTGGEYLIGIVLLAGTWMMGATASATVGAILYNLLAEIAGGIEFTVFEDVPVEASRMSGDGAAVVRGVP